MIQIRMGPTNDIVEIGAATGRVQTWQLEDRNGITQFRGTLLGVASSRREDHSHGATPVDGAPGQALFDSYHSRKRCTACRWSEIYIFTVTAGDVPPNTNYCVYTLGPSIVGNELTFGRIRWISSGHEVIEVCTVRRGDRGSAWLPAAHARALAMAADQDDRIERAYVNRAVA